MAILFNELKLSHVLLGCFPWVALQHTAYVMGGGISCDLTWDMPLGQTIINVGDSSFPGSAHYRSVMSALGSEK